MGIDLWRNYTEDELKDLVSSQAVEIEQLEHDLAAGETECEELRAELTRHQKQMAELSAEISRLNRGISGPEAINNGGK